MNTFLSIHVFWEVMPCSVSGSWHRGSSRRRRSAWPMGVQALHCSEMSGTTYPATQHHIRRFETSASLLWEPHILNTLHLRIDTVPASEPLSSIQQGSGQVQKSSNTKHDMLLYESFLISISLFIGTRVVQNLLGMLKARGVKKVAGLFKDVISSTTDKSSGLSGEDPRPWNNKERMYGTDLFAR